MKKIFMMALVAISLTACAQKVTSQVTPDSESHYKTGTYIVTKDGMKPAPKPEDKLELSCVLKHGFDVVKPMPITFYSNRLIFKKSGEQIKLTEGQQVGKAYYRWYDDGSVMKEYSGTVSITNPKNRGNHIWCEL